MICWFKTLQACFLLVSIQLLSSCVIVPQEQEQEPKSKANIQVELSQYKQSNFKQVEATFLTHQSKALVFRVLSNIDQTSQWLQRVDSLEVLAVYNNHQYLLRTIINSPWPFQNRELITCVNTFFEENITTIKIFSCSDRVPLNDLYVRLLHVESSWRIRKIADSLVEVNYKTWLDPAGIVPAFIFNSELIDSTEVDLKKLQTIIENASLDQYSY
ncbi:MAG: hypothetical protein ACJAS1_004734 [Oleiphilaceae bacterium]|jgi:hypothetical protein